MTVIELYVAVSFYIILFPHLFCLSTTLASRPQARMSFHCRPRALLALSPLSGDLPLVF